MSPYRKLFETVRELTRLRAKYERPESDEQRTERQRLWLWEAFTQGEDPHATGAIVSDPADVQALTAGWEPDV